MEKQRDWLTVAEVAAELRVSPGRVRQWITSGDLRSQKSGSTHLIHRSGIDPLRERKTNPGPAKGTPPSQGGRPRTRPTDGRGGEEQ